MPSEFLQILHLEDSPDDAFLIRAILQEEFQDLVIVQVNNQEDYLRNTRDPRTRLVLSDYSLPGYDGIRALSAVRHLRPELPFIFVSGAMGEDMAVDCMRIGATDYVLKSNLKRLPSAIRRALNEANIRMTLTEAARVARVVPWRWSETEDTWVFGYLVQDILGYPKGVLESTQGFLRAHVHVEDLHRFMSSLSLAKERERMEFDCRLLHGEGRWLWTRWTAAWADGKCRGVFQDITELHSVQEALIQSQRLETLGMMVGGITHDFGNLITAMNGAIEALTRGPLTESQRRCADILGKSCTRAMEFRTELLRLARKEDAPVRSQTQLNEVAKEAVTLLSHAIPKSIEITFEAGEELPRIPAVPSQLLQVLMNLGINARDAMGDRGRMILRTGITVLSEAETPVNHQRVGTYVFAEIEDTGTGIPPDVLPRMFEPFFTTKGNGQGTGLGLAIVRAIIQQHDGLLQVRSDPGKGACLRMLLPAVSED